MSRRLIAGLTVLITFATVTVAVAQEGTPEPVTVQVPDSRFTVYHVVDPYVGTIVSPPELPSGTRVIAAEVGIANRSDLSLTVFLANLRLRDRAGREYLAGSVFGTETRLNNRTLAAEERARGWVWFSVPANAEITQFVFIGAAPEYRLPWSDTPLETGTPVSEEASPAAE